MRPAAINLLCLPCAGASATMYLRWRRLLPAWIHVVPVELPGRGVRLEEAPIENFDALVAQLCEEQAGNLTGTYALFGHSMGALLSYGIAQRLRMQALSKPGAALPKAALPQVLFASCHGAPSTHDAGRFADKESDAALIADLHEQGGTPDEIFASPELLRITLDALQADYRMCGSFRYSPGLPLPLSVHAFGGIGDGIAAARLEAWRLETSGPFLLEWFDGGHFCIRQSEDRVLQSIVRGLLPLVTKNTVAA